LEFVVIISVETLHLKVNKYDCLRVSCTDATPRWVKKLGKNPEKNPTNSPKKTSAHQLPEEKKKRKNIYIYIQPDPI